MRPDETIEVSKLKMLVEDWTRETDAIREERAALKKASDILGDGLLEHSIELWDMKCCRLQRCTIALQMVLLGHVEELMSNAQVQPRPREARTSAGTVC